MPVEDKLKENEIKVDERKMDFFFAFMEQIYLSIYLFREETVVLFRDRVRTNHEEMQYLAILWQTHGLLTLVLISR